MISLKNCLKNLFLFFAISYSVTASAQWRLVFSQDGLPLTKSNQMILDKLAILLQSGESLPIAYRFSSSRQAAAHWKAFTQYFSQQGIHFQGYFSINADNKLGDDVLSVSLLPFESSHYCSGKFIISDPALPISTQGLSLQGNHQLSVSARATLQILTDGDISKNYYIFARQPNTQRFRDIRKLRSANIPLQLGPSGEVFYLIAVPNTINAPEISALQQALKNSYGEYVNLTFDPNLEAVGRSGEGIKTKAASLGAIPFLSGDVVDDSETTRYQAPPKVALCRLHLQALRP